MTTSAFGTVLVLDEKWGPRYLDASTSEKRALAFLSVLRKRMEEGYWYDRPREPEFDEETLDLAAVEDEAFFSTGGLPESISSSLYQKHVAAKQRIRHAKDEFDRENQWFVRADAVLALSEEEFLQQSDLDSKKRNEAEVLLDLRSDYEYESFELSRLESITL